jgi:hypothetical protein
MTFAEADHPPPQHKVPERIEPKVPDMGDLADRINAACHAAELALADGFTRAMRIVASAPVVRTLDTIAAGVMQTWRVETGRI